MAAFTSEGYSSPSPSHTTLADATYKQRNVVERCFNRLKQFRALATR